MERRQLEYFLAVIDAGGFTAAAAAQHVSQPGLSHAIKTLERELGAALFHRLPRGARLTAAGEVLAESARRIVRETEIARARVADVAGVVIGRLDLVALPGLLVDPLAETIGRFRALHPQVQIRIVPAETPATIREAVRGGTAELGMTDEEPGSGELAVDLVTDQEFLAVLPPGSAVPEGDLPLRTLLGMDVVTGPVGTTVRDFLAFHAAGLGIEVTPVVEVALRGSAAYLAIAGAGVAVLPLPMAEMCRSYGVILRSLDPPLRRNVYLLRRTGSLSPAARAMRALLLPDA
ncbi:LysR substrate-binding domain-containing protein [Actinoallomurus bryophytorum]|uniref:DNA-binding transcriptional LysR family regulator n=1 Tax=Actinoallomurus bryophytorum TaxID=1490222 RepID=A0A543CTJ9_9ACTN|nr:LysR family transcriptional regulator [Actinoallomurus bryophytorum]TQM00432.1 DNA-binding transcriptional LysR family regulator [Actinoallomurus bryophytorum]